MAALVWPLILLLSGYIHGNVYVSAGSCKFPSRWEGEWFQSGVRQSIVIEGDRASSKGRCLASEGDKFLVVDDKGQCYRCVVIHEKHANVLQYKETYCHGRSAELGSLCALITGDALLYSMFRLAASPVACPFRGSFSFSYNRGHGECAAPASSLQQCTEDWRVLLSFHACPDVAGTESSVEELACVATWKEGSARYLVGRLRHRHATSDEERYRCFVYEKAGGEPELQQQQQVATSRSSHAGEHVDFWVAQSGDATCNGLFNPLEGSRTLKLRKVAASTRSCKFPPWLIAHAHWYSLDRRLDYHVTHRNSTLRIISTSDSSVPNDGNTNDHELHEDGTWRGGDARLACVDIRASFQHSAKIVAHLTHGCQNGFVCLMFYRRDPHVVELQTGATALRMEDACLPHYFNPDMLPFTTLVTLYPEPRDCPHVGIFGVSGAPVLSPVAGAEKQTTIESNGGSVTCAPDFTSLAVGCGALDTMEFRSPECAVQRQQQSTAASYSCHGGWEDNGTHFLITTPLSRTSHGARRLCFMFHMSGAEQLLLSSSAASCTREQHVQQAAAQLTLTSHGECLVASSATILSSSTTLLMMIVAALTLPTLRPHFLS